MSRFIESIKVEDREIFLIEYHQKRVNDTFAHFEKECKINLLQIFKDLELDEDGLFKFKITYDLEGNYKEQLIPYAIPEIEDFELVSVEDLDYRFKYEDRKKLNQIKEKSSCEEVIIVVDNWITDTSFSNLIFLKDKKWYTPTTYLLNGVQRQNLLKTNQIEEIQITLDNIKEFTHFQIVNAMNDFDDMFVYPISKIRNLPAEYRYLEI